MVGILILSHGSLARELLESARIISGDLPGFDALTLDWRDGLETAREEVAATIERLNEGNGVLILTDMYGSTPSNVAMSFREPGQIEVVAGVNLPMVVRLGCLTTKSMPLPEMASWICEKGRSSICGSRKGVVARKPDADCEEE